MQSFNREDYIHKLEKENEELQQMYLGENYEKAKLVGQLNKAKELIKNIIRVTYGEGWNYSLDWKVKAEQFLKEE